MLDDRESVCVRYVCVNRFPDSCGECPFAVTQDGYSFSCVAVDPLKCNIVGNPKDMTYRRSDCPLLVTES